MSLSLRRTKFVDEYMLDGNASRAARAAGYAVSGARVTAHRLLTNANVKAVIALKTDVLAQQYELSKHAVVNEIRSAITLAEAKLDPNAMIRGWTEIAKIMGFYSTGAADLHPKQAYQGDGALKAKLETLSDDELIAIVNG